jgi:hypothetical protein
LATAASDEEIRRLAREILSEPAFARWRPAASDSLSRWITEWLQWLASFLTGQADVSLAAYALFWTIVALLLYLVVTQVVRTVRAMRAPRASSAAALPDARPVDFVAQAEAFEREGRYLEAAHCLHLGCIESLVQSGVLRLSRSEPNRTLRTRLRASSLSAADSEELCSLLDRMESSWFRTRDADSPLYEAWRSAHRRIVGGAAR